MCVFVCGGCLCVFVCGCGCMCGGVGGGCGCVCDDSTKHPLTNIDVKKNEKSDCFSTSLVKNG